MSEFKVTLAKVDDTELLVKHRLGMWNDMRPELKEKAKGLEDLTRSWIKKNLSEGKLIGLIARTESGEVAGSGCVWIKEQPPRLVSERLEEPYLMSMFTEEAFRRRGVASIIVQSAIDWCKEHGYNTISLHSAEAGISLYQSFGFKPTTEMRLML